MKHDPHVHPIDSGPTAIYPLSLLMNESLDRVNCPAARVPEVASL